MTARSIRSPSPCTSVGASRESTVSDGARRRRRSTAPETIASTRTSPGSPLGRPPRASSTMSPTSAVSSSSSWITSARNASRSASGRRSSSRISCRLARIEAIGVRSSWEASATIRRWARTDRSSASSVWLNVAASRASSSAPSTWRRSCSIRSGWAAIDSVWRVNRAIGDSAVRATTIPSRPASRIPAAAIAINSVSWLDNAWSTSVSGSATASAPRLPIPVTSTPDVRTRDRHVRDVLTVPAPGQALDRRGRGDLGALAAGDERPAARIEQRVDPRRGPERRPAQAIEPEPAVAGARPLVDRGSGRRALPPGPGGCGPCGR